MRSKPARCKACLWLFKPAQLLEMESQGMLTLQAGAKHGLGTYTWPNGAMYSGEWQAGCMHGVGTFEGPDGTTYQARLSRQLMCDSHSSCAAWQCCESCWAMCTGPCVIVGPCLWLHGTLYMHLGGNEEVGCAGATS